MEKSRIQKLVSEFDNLKLKLDNDMSNYSKEKQWLQWRISNLEKDNSELQKAMQPSVEKLQEPLEKRPLRKTMSEPDFADDMSLEGDGGSTNDSQELVEYNLFTFKTVSLVLWWRVSRHLPSARTLNNHSHSWPTFLILFVPIWSKC